MIEITSIIEQLVEEYPESPFEINCGLCDLFAADIIVRMGGYSDDLTEGSIANIDSPYWGHVWIEYQGKYYDAECPTGIGNYRQLPIFNRVS